MGTHNLENSFLWPIFFQKFNSGSANIRLFSIESSHKQTDKYKYRDKHEETAKAVWIPSQGRSRITRPFEIHQEGSFWITSYSKQTNTNTETNTNQTQIKHKSNHEQIDANNSNLGKLQRLSEFRLEGHSRIWRPDVADESRGPQRCQRPSRRPKGLDKLNRF